MAKIARITQDDVHEMVRLALNMILKEDSSFDDRIVDKICDDLNTNGITIDDYSYGDFIKMIIKHYACSFGVADKVSIRMGFGDDDWPEERIEDRIDIEANMDDYPV